MQGTDPCLTTDPSYIEQKVGYAIISLYIAQLLLGMFIHFIRVPFLFVGHRPPQNYLHPVLGLLILAMADYQVRLFLCYCAEGFLSHCR